MIARLLDHFAGKILGKHSAEKRAAAARSKRLAVTRQMRRELGLPEDPRLA